MMFMAWKEMKEAEEKLLKMMRGEEESTEEKLDEKPKEKKESPLKEKCEEPKQCIFRRCCHEFPMRRMMWRHPELFYRLRMFGPPSPWRPLRFGPEMWGPQCGTRMWRPLFGPRMCCQSQCEMRKTGIFGPPPMMPRCHTPLEPRMCCPQMRFNIKMRKF